MTIYVDNAYASSSGSAPHLTTETRSALQAALTSLLAQPAIASFLSPISRNVIFTNFGAGLGSDSGSGVYYPEDEYGVKDSAWRAQLAIHFATDYDHDNPEDPEDSFVDPVPFDAYRDIVVYFSQDTLDLLTTSVAANRYGVYDENGSKFDYSMARMMFHELAHIVSEPSAAARLDWDRSRERDEVWEADTIANNAEDIIFRAAFPSEKTIAGHGPMIGISNFAGVAAFDFMHGTPAMYLAAIDGTNAAVFEEAENGTYIRKIIFSRVVGSRGAVEQLMNHYVINEVKEGDNRSIIDDQGSLSEYTRLMLRESAPGLPAEPDSRAANTLFWKTAAIAHHAESLKETREASTSFTYVPKELEEVFESLPDFKQQDLRLISAESSAIERPLQRGVSNIAVGPIVAGSGATENQVLYIPVVASDGKDTVIIGAAGFKDRNVDFSDQLDDLKGSSGKDILIGGDGSAGSGGSERNLLDGGAGDDILVTGRGQSTVKGGLGNDLILAGSGDSRIEGGKGKDVFAFANAEVSSIIDVSDQENGYVKARQGDAIAQIHGVEIYLGGDATTVFIGKANEGSVFIAGRGGGDFTLTSKDRAFGFDNVKDIYRVTTKPADESRPMTDAEMVAALAKNKVFIGNFGPEDEL